MITIGAVIAFLIGGAGAYFIYKNLDKIYDGIEFPSNGAQAVLLKFAILIDIMVVTASSGALFTGVPVAEFAMPLVSFVAGFYFFLYKPTSWTSKKKSK
jgi:hypothetical protein|tara:strand:- start:53914 stop:54210 length:297 start_codon:yes stop_codon:yes gene_type:complete